ncbi:MAG: phosphatase PAP2 family protein, partial [Bacteroidota bacterium]
VNSTQSYPRLIWYFLTLGFVCLLGSIYLFYWGYEASFLQLNALSTPFLDQFMPHWTHMGEGAILSCVLILWLLSRDLPLAISVALGMISVMIIVAGLKQGIFEDWHRPAGVFALDQFRFLSLGQERHFSFPSGHSTAAATLYGFLCFSIASRRSWSGIFWGLLALSIAYTRIYIGVHFLGDVIAGLLLGCGILALFLWFFYPFVERLLKALTATKLRLLRIGMGIFAISLGLFAIWNLLDTYYL